MSLIVLSMILQNHRFERSLFTSRDPAPLKTALRIRQLRNRSFKLGTNHDIFMHLTEFPNMHNCNRIVGETK